MTTLDRDRSTTTLVGSAAPRFPAAVGPLSALTIAAIRSPDGSRAGDIPDVDVHDPVGDLDFQLALHLLHELHYRGFDGAHPDAEWHPAIVALWQRLAHRFEDALLADVPQRDVPRDENGDAAVGTAIERHIATADGPSLSQHVLDDRSGTALREFAIHRSAYQLKEADPHSFALPRLAGRAKAAFVEIQMDEYGDGVPGRAHADLFAVSMAGLGLDPTYGAYVDVLPAATLATTNLITHLALHRRLLPALLGHLALFEMTSVVPMGRYAEAMRRSGAPESACEFYDVHVVADEHHGPLAKAHLVDAYIDEHPDEASLTLWGAEITSAVESRFATALIDAWTEGRSSLRPASRWTDVAGHCPTTPGSWQALAM